TPGGSFVFVLVMMGMCMVLMMMSAPVCVVMMVIVIMIVHMMRRLFAPQQTQESAAFDPKQAQADQHDQRIADDFNHADGITHRLGSSAQECGSDADDRDGHECLKHRRSERQKDATPPGLVIGDQVGRDHSLAVTRPGRVENAVKERNAEQRVCG